MSSRPSRTTRSSTAAAAASAQAPAASARTRSSVAAPSTSSAAATRRTTRSSRANTPGPAPEVKVTHTRASATRAASTASAAASSSSTRPLWSSSRANFATPPPATTPAAKRTSTLAVPGSTLRSKTPGSGLLSRMTSRESLRPTKTPGAAVGAAYEKLSDGIEGSREPLKAFLRIRPAPANVPLQSYLQVMNETDVLMVPPMDHRLNPSSSSSSLFASNLLLRSSHLNLNPSSHPSGVPDDVLASPTPQSFSHGPDPSTFGTLYKFTSVFPPSASPFSSSDLPSMTDSSQASFFRSTALPLVRDFLQKGENCLLFAYGPTGSGKTWTVQGGAGDEAGLLPRIVEVVWKSVEKKRRASHKVTPPGSRAPSRAGPPMTSTPTGKIPIPEQASASVNDDNSEIYNEKIYDLLDSPLPTPTPSAAAASAANGGGGMFKGLFRNFTTVKRSALSLKADKSAAAAAQGQKVVNGLREVEVASAEEAHAVLARGQSNRRVFSTLANRASSRSHSIFTLHLSRKSRATGAELGSSRFSIVDLAGSERVQNTQAEGDRLKEAGNINKSLMVLGQCMEVLRKNQEREKGRRPALVPFRHSKLTEMFQSFFVGDGKAVMIVNINPYETGFDENSHVMKFAAVASSVTTVKRGTDNFLAPVPEMPAVQPTPTVKDKSLKKEPKLVRVSLIEGGEEEEVLYEEDDSYDDDDDEDMFVSALLDELSTLRTALYESQMQTVLAESNARAQVVKEYEAKMLDMERQYQARLREEAVEAENKLNAKLDILTRLQQAKTPGRAGAVGNRLASVTPSTAYDDSDEDEDEEDEQSEDASEHVRGMLLPAETSFADSAASMSPLAARVKTLAVAAPSTSQALTTAPTESSPLRQVSAEPESASVATAQALAADPQSGKTGEASRTEDAADDTADIAAEVDEVEAARSSPTEESEDKGDDHDELDESSLSLGEADDTLESEDDFVDDGAVDDDSDDDFSASPAPSPKKKPLSVKKSQAHASLVAETVSTPAPAARSNKENEEPLSSTPGNGDDDGEYGEADEFGLDRSMVIRSGSKTKKTKRKLGGKVVDVDDLDTFEGVLSPIRKTPSSRSFSKR
ncbi:hypothetical protein Rhopal_003388-T1 [Rhodotorula paludigena]|uniref:Kinesin motor domain-containing protein n=1 Tax=Rhodotorula paludigena TaxID=86838 RepID=A0AAV5GLM6_9BASI|nr:hypothetical protein Rhopal_003388-T1 [Rhodotorula paludigena]